MKRAKISDALHVFCDGKSRDMILAGSYKYLSDLMVTKHVEIIKRAKSLKGRIICVLKTSHIAL
jgi:hypothetical protein